MPGRAPEHRTLVAQVSSFGRPEDEIELVQPDPGEPGPGEAIVETEFFPRQSPPTWPVTSPGAMRSRLAPALLDLGNAVSEGKFRGPG